MTDMLEKIARAIAYSYYASDYDSEEAKAWAAKDWEDWLPEARAALLAMRVLDDATRQRGSEIYCKGQSGLFTCMIDAILAQPSTPTDVTSA